ncbi:hypothetical protein Dda_3735 [Drechslerella dactyloides]|uniref:Uncharacterized protein n=1 Tax=Drechslerella dactyloides TaxID=74499 RepID=A0AAD6NK68_DREDA|nr:hypothetical protein Dda_3735 [Drechslerella dactyloides]
MLVRFTRGSTKAQPQGMESFVVCLEPRRTGGVSVREVVEMCLIARQAAARRRPVIGASDIMRDGRAWQLERGTPADSCPPRCNRLANSGRAAPPSDLIETTASPISRIPASYDCRSSPWAIRNRNVVGARAAGCVAGELGPVVASSEMDE